jgi:predicted transcriptional regulator
VADPDQLSKRERQIMQILYARGEGTATDVVAAMPDAPTRTTVRTLLRILEEKGHLAHEVKGREFLYRPTRARSQVGRTALRSVLQSFFSNSMPKALASYLADPRTMLTLDEAQELKRLIDEARKRGD